MTKIGQFNDLVIIKEVPFGLYLDGKGWGEILLPNKFVPEGAKVGDVVSVFVYFDSEDKIIATTQRPRAQIGKCAYLKVVDVNAVGAFLDWGLDKDLLVPGPEQQRPMQIDKSYIVYLKQDSRGRIIASSKLDYHLDKSVSPFAEGDEVQLLIAEKTQLGNKVIVNDGYWGLVHHSDIFQNLYYGKKMLGYIKAIRDDGKIDVSLRKPGQDRIVDLATRILIALEKKGGFLAVHDKSSAFEIQQIFGESKKSFKAAIGQLYKQKKIRIEEEGIRLL